MLESVFQSELIKDLEFLFPGCIVLKNDPNYIQGFPDLTILYKNMWAVLECKKSKDAPFQPNQEYYLELLDGMSYASVIWPEIKEEVLNELQQAFRVRGTSRVLKRK
jgi:hypothetical protein